MQEDVIFQISNRLKELRQNKKVTIEKVAKEVGVSKAMISQIENSRAVPSLTVLLTLIKALGITPNDFFEAILPDYKSSDVIIKSSKDYQSFSKENARGFHYKRILTTSLQNIHIDVVLLHLEKNSKRAMVRTKAFEYKYVLKGSVKYTVGQNEYLLNEGDSIYFDANELHNLKALNDKDAELLIVYMFTEELI